MNDLLVVVIVLPAAAFAGAVVARLVWPRTLTNAVLAGILLLGALEALAWAAIVTDFRDADGFIDCWPHCTLRQGVVGTTVWWSPILRAALVVLTAAYLGLTSRRAKRRLDARRSA